MSILIDKVIDTYAYTKASYDNGYFIAKPYYHKVSLFSKLKDCFRILSDKSIAIHFREDDIACNYNTTFRNGK